MFIKSLATAVGLTAIFGMASAADLPTPLCTTTVDAPANQTECTYRQPQTRVVGPMSGSKEFTKMMKGTEPSACTAYFKEMQKKLGPCKIAPVWTK